MKNLPEKDFWGVIKKRLENYKEDPQDDWLKIAAVIPSPGSHRQNNMNIASDLLSAAGLVFLLWALFVVTPPAPAGKPDLLQAQAALSEKMMLQADALKAGKADPEKKDKRQGPQQDVVPVNRQKLPKAAPILNDAAIADKHTAPQMIHVDYVVAETGGIQPAPDSTQADKVIKTDTVYFSVPPVLQQKPKPKRKFRPSVYAMITPSLAYQKVIPLRNDDINIQKLNGAGIVSADRLGVGMEAGFQMQVSNYFELYAALSYYQQQQSVSYSYASATGIQVGGTGNPWSYQLSPGEATRRFSYNMKNAGAAAGVLYHLRGRKLMHKIGAGLQYQKGLISSRGEYSYNNAASAYLNYQLMYRMEYSLTGRASFFLQPQFIHSIISTEELHEPFNIKPYRAGIGFGLVYHLY